MNNKDMSRLCDIVRATSLKIHAYHRHGHMEKVYENALKNRLGKQVIQVRQQYPLPVYDEDGAEIGEYFADLFIEKSLIVEVKACKAITGTHSAQLIGYLRSSHTEHGMLINFGASRLQIKKYELSKV